MHYFIGACPTEYMLSPISSTCYTYAPYSKSWGDAKEYCETTGDKFASFTNPEELTWLTNTVISTLGQILQLATFLLYLI